MRPLESAIVITARPEDSIKTGFYSKNGRLAARGEIADAADSRAQARELFLDPLVAAVEVIDALHGGGATRDQSRQHQARGGAQIGRHDGGPVEMGHALHDRGIALDLDVGAETLQLLHVHEAI